VGVAKLTVYDANNGTSSATAAFHVYVDPAILGISPVPGRIDLGQSVTFIVTGAAGGTGVYTYRWTGLPAGCVGANNRSVECTPTVSGPSNVTVTITDTNGVSANQSVAFTVDPALSVGAPTASAGSGEVGQSLTFSVAVTGGRGPMTFVWSGLPTGCVSENTSSVACTPSGTGTFRVSVNVTDSNQVTAESRSISISVSSAPFLLLGAPLLDWYVIWGVLTLGAVVAALVALRRVRKRRRAAAAANSS
jgi:hypothetical protein